MGKHKARVFLAALGIGVEQATLLRDALVAAARDGEAALGKRDHHGQRYTVDFRMRGPAGEAAIRSGWIIGPGEENPRLTTAYVLMKGRADASE